MINNGFHEISLRMAEPSGLSREEARAAMRGMVLGEWTAAQAAGFLTACRLREVRAEEILGYCDALREQAVPLKLSSGPFIDLCGTGGDGKETFNISTLAAFAVAGSGMKVVKHGNYGFSSLCGSSNLLEALGVKLPRTESEVERDLERAGIAFLHAPLFHPAMGKLAPVRRELGIRTIFNLLGPLLNPAEPPAQLIGIFPRSLAGPYGEVLRTRPVEWTLVHSLDGYDEISLTGTMVVTTRAKELHLEPGELGFARVDPAELAGGRSAGEAKEKALKVLRGNGTAAEASVVIANAALALCTLQPALSHAEGISRARESLESGRALKSLERLCA
jgi:anthranilate phosphoribosyltransferase